MRNWIVQRAENLLKQPVIEVARSGRLEVTWPHGRRAVASVNSAQLELWIDLNNELCATVERLSAENKTLRTALKHLGVS